MTGKISQTPFELRKTPQMAQFFEDIGKRLHIDSVDAVASADASDLSTAITLANELKAQLNAVLTAMKNAETMET